jgi:integrase
MCRDAAIRFGWGANYNPFFGFKKLPEKTGTYEINPFSMEEQKLIIDCLPAHWKPYFRFAFCSGLRQGEQFALKSTNIDWDKDQITISKAMTLDEQGRRIEGQTKNQYSQRQIQLSSAMKSALLEQKAISDGLSSEYLFCTTNGHLLNHANLCNRVWTPVLKEAGLSYRPMIQTRHSFASAALSLGENPLWIARTMGHRDTDMVIRVYAKYATNAANQLDGKALSEAHLKVVGNQE